MRSIASEQPSTQPRVRITIRLELEAATAVAAAAAAVSVEEGTGPEGWAGPELGAEISS